MRRVCQIESFCIHAWCVYNVVYSRHDTRWNLPLLRLCVYLVPSGLQKLARDGCFLIGAKKLETQGAAVPPTQDAKYH
eukprot:2386328-Amphidinium_carterae.1